MHIYYHLCIKLENSQVNQVEIREGKSSASPENERKGSFYDFLVFGDRKQDYSQ